jgi:choloylglycine hydrolase
MGAMGLPGDLSSASRFIKAAFTKLHSVTPKEETASVSQFFHILSAVEQPMGCCRVGEGAYERTLYTSCCNVDKGIYYYTTYGNHRITAVALYREDLEGSRLIRYPLLREEQIRIQN